jgi:hypothetical protein
MKSGNCRPPSYRRNHFSDRKPGHRGQRTGKKYAASGEARVPRFRDPAAKPGNTSDVALTPPSVSDYWRVTRMPQGHLPYLGLPDARLAQPGGTGGRGQADGKRAAEHSDSEFLFHVLTPLRSALSMASVGIRAETPRTRH